MFFRNSKFSFTKQNICNVSYFQFDWVLFIDEIQVKLYIKMAKNVLIRLIYLETKKPY